jgi:hypothetical protein
MVFAQPFRNQDPEEPEGTAFEAGGRQKREFSADIFTAMQWMDESLQDYQGYRLPVKGNDLRFQFPFAVYLEPGDVWKNIDTGAEMTVDRTFRDEDGDPSGEAIFKTDGDVPPAMWDRLRPQAENRVRFVNSWPKSLSETYKFKDDSNLEQVNRPWNDTITWMVARREPGSVGAKPFTGTREVRPRFREDIVEEEVNCDYIRAIKGQQFDVLVQFDIWAKTNRRAVVLLDWFMNFMDLYRWVWEYNGVKRVQYWRQTSDALVTRWRNDIVSRSIQYYFQIERLSSYRIRRIRDIEVIVDTLAHADDFVGRETMVDPSGCVDPTGQIPVELVDGPGILF